MFSRFAQTYLSFEHFKRLIHTTEIIVFLYCQKAYTNENIMWNTLYNTRIGTSHSQHSIYKQEKEHNYKISSERDGSIIGIRIWELSSDIFVDTKCITWIMKVKMLAKYYQAMYDQGKQNLGGLQWLEWKFIHIRFSILSFQYINFTLAYLKLM